MSGFKSCSYVVFFLCLALASLIGPGSSIHFSWICFKWHVHVVNQLSSGRSLFVHCKSKDDDLGQRDLAIGSWYSWNWNSERIASDKHFTGATYELSRGTPSYILNLMRFGRKIDILGLRTDAPTIMEIVPRSAFGLQKMMGRT